MLGPLLVVSALVAPLFASPVGVTPLDAHTLFRRLSSSCSTTGTQSCQNSTAVANTCCFETGGLLPMVQFWDANPATGPSNSWTIHGLWPDYCDGTYPSSCDPSRAYTDIAGLLTSQGASDTLSYMNTFWKNQGASDETLWEHEWSKHGTCMSTLRTSCLPSGSAKGAEAVAFFQTVVRLFKTFPTYDWLAAAGILPSSSKTWTRAQLASAIQSQWGFTPALDCSSSELFQISYYHNLKGSIIDGSFIPIDAPSAGSCPSTGIKYLPKSGSSTPTGTTTSGGSTPTGGLGSLPSKANIQGLIASGATIGGLLTAGTWSTQTLATMSLSGSTSGFTMKSSKGSCGVSTSGVLSCGSGVTASTFTAISGSSGSLLLAYGGSTAFTSNDTPSGSTAQTLYTGSSHASDLSLVISST